MKNCIGNFRMALLASLAVLAALLPVAASAQVVTRLPVYIDNSTATYDFGNGPLEFQVVLGSAGLFTSSGSGLGSTSGSSTSLTLTATPPAGTTPCVGCIISGTGITSGTTVTAYNGTTGVTLSAAMTVAASTPLAWGSACPGTVGASRLMLVPAGVTAYPFYTQARICGASQFAAGAAVLPFAIGAH